MKITIQQNRLMRLESTETCPEDQDTKIPATRNTTHLVHTERSQQRLDSMLGPIICSRKRVQLFLTGALHYREERAHDTITLSTASAILDSQLVVVLKAMRT